LQRQKEFELLKKENELLKKEIEQLKKEIELLKKQETKEAGRAKATKAPKGTLDGVTYEVTKSRMNGPNWELTLTALSEEGEKRLTFCRCRAITEDGKVYTLGKATKPLMPEGLVRLPEGVKIQIKLNMGSVPSGIKEFSRIELHRGRIGSDNLEPLVLKNVTVGGE
jgi:hypothetical protein